MLDRHASHETCGGGAYWFGASACALPLIALTVGVLLGPG